VGEELALVVYLHEGESLTEQALRDFLNGRLAGYKVPKHIQFWEHPLPQNASGKLHKLNVRKAFLGED
jgi:acyl-CoA synthetase (AMP-forming)/AMP-acid ligase II